MLRGIIDLFYPPLCAGCDARVNKGILFCEQCLNSLPTTEHALRADNKALALFPKQDKLLRASSFCFYEHDSAIRNALHKLKYYHQPWIGPQLGQLAATQMTQQNNELFKDIDLIIPIPLHPEREKQRTYNQSELIAQGISKITNLPIDNSHLKRIVNNPTQTGQDTAGREKNVEGIFKVENEKDLRGKTILLVDDILTTGATMRSAIKTLHHIRNLKFEIFTIAITKYLS